MTIGIDQYRMRVGLFKPNRQQSKCYLNIYEVLCSGLIIYTKNKKHALLAVVLISCLTEFKVKNKFRKIRNEVTSLVRDRPFNLKGGYGFLFRSEIFFQTTQELKY